ncbi:MAG TPA: FeoB-associated Cys-rich membrane protein [Gemmatimonadaceae bacterium]
MNIGIPEIIIALILAAVAYVAWKFWRSIQEGKQQS